MLDAAAACVLAAASLAAAAAAAAPDAYAQNVTFSTGQSEYYFAAGEQPIVPLEVYNGHGRAVSGVLSYNTAHTAGEGNVQSRTVNIGSQRFELREGNNTVMIDMGTASAPSTLEVDLEFSYNDGFYPWSISFGPVIVHIVEDPSEVRNEQDPMVSHAQQQGAGGQQQAGQQQAGQQQAGQQQAGQQQAGQQQAGQQQGQGQRGQQGQQAGQQQGQQAGQQPPAPDPLDRLQNRQMDQDSAALRRQMQGQLEEEAGRQGRFAEALSADPTFAEQHRRMIDAGYGVASTKFDPSSESDGDDGSFEVRYESGERGDASIQGAMEDGRVSELDVSSEYEEGRMLDALREDPRFAEMSAELEEGGYGEAGAQFTSDGSTTEAVIEYSAASEGADAKAVQQARIRAEFNGTDITAVSLEYEEEEEVDPALAVLAAAVAGGLAAAAYLAVFGQGAAPVLVPALAPARRSDPEAEARRLIDKAHRLHEEGDEKRAVAHAARAVRLLLAGRLGMDREVTNAEMAEEIRLRGPGARGQEGGAGSVGAQDGIVAAACLEAADLVEFAKASPGGSDFGRISLLFDRLLADQGGKNLHGRGS